jgi:hypothetical protein
LSGKSILLTYDKIVIIKIEHVYIIITDTGEGNFSLLVKKFSPRRLEEEADAAICNGQL